MGKYFRNSTHAFLFNLKKIVKNGVDVSARGQKTKELLSQRVKIQNPLQRVIVTPHRNNNIFATIAETVWVLSGRNDLNYLSRYLPRAVDFSDDGKVWRGGYGPRLRNWRGIDQVQEIVRILNTQKETRRAVIIIYDPVEDFIDSKDIPCNNWLQFLIRDNKLHLNVTVRSNDLIWGFTGINTFEWSVLHEMVAYWTGVSVCTATYFIGSLHLYERHFRRAQNMRNSAKRKTLYDFGFTGTRFKTAFPRIDDVFHRWFVIEDDLRNDRSGCEVAINEFDDPLFKNCLQMIKIYNRSLNGATNEEVQRLVKELPSNDFKIAAIEYFARKGLAYKEMLTGDREMKFFKYYYN